MRRTLAALTASVAIVVLVVGVGATRAADHALAYAAIQNASCGLVSVSRLPSPFLSAEVDFPLVALVAAALGYRRWRRGEDWRAPAWLLVALLVATGVEFGAKHVVASATPSQVFGPISSREDCGGESYALVVVKTPFSFPSGSIMRLAFLCTLAVAFLRPRALGYGLTILALPIAVTRVPIGWHWPSDLVGGWVIGTLAACAALAAMRAPVTARAGAAPPRPAEPARVPLAARPGTRRAP